MVTKMGKFLLLLVVSFLPLSSNHSEGALTEDEVIRFILSELGLEQRFANPVSFNENIGVPKGSHTHPIINIYDSLLSIGNFSIDKVHFEAIGLNVDEYGCAVQMPNKKMPINITQLKSVKVLNSLPDFGPEMVRYVVVSRVFVLNRNQAVFAINFACYEGCGRLELYKVSKSQNELVADEVLVVNLD
jgi:hypothetical protein